MRIADIDYITGRDRNEDNAVAHLYKGTMVNPGNPMCLRGWNRSDGKGYSIFRNLPGIAICKVCLRRAEQRKDSVPSRSRKTKWI